MDGVLAELLAEVPDELFFNDQGHPAYNRIFVEVVRFIYKEDGVNFSIPAQDFLADKLPNLTTFQKSVSVERKRRERYRRA